MRRTRIIVGLFCGRGYFLALALLSAACGGSGTVTGSDGADPGSTTPAAAGNASRRASVVDE